MMRTGLFVLPLAAVLYLPFAASAQTVVPLGFQRIVKAAVADGTLDGTVKFYLKGQDVPGNVVRVFSETTVKNTARETSPEGKSDEQICRVPARKVLVALQEYAKEWGANAIVDIEGLDAGEGQPNPGKINCRTGRAYDHFVIMSGRAVIVK